MDRRILKAKRRRNHHSRHENTREQIDVGNCDTSDPCGSGVKRKFEDRYQTPLKRNRQEDRHEQHKPMGYSANDRLKRYRNALEQKKNQVVKVHKVLQDNVDVAQLKHVSVSTSTSMLQQTVLSPQVNLEAFKLNKSDNLNRNKSVVLDEPEYMDWSPVDEEEVAADIRILRNTPRLPQPNPLYLTVSAENISIGRSLTSDDPLFVIVDTNIFISHLNLIKDISNLHRKLKVKPIIYIPWMVLQELDYFKDGRSTATNVQNAAKRAVSFINDMLTTKNKALKGQTVHEALTHDFSNSNADDSILFCCLRLQQNRSKIILLSNDQNLRSKVMVHSIEACSTKTIMDVLKNTNRLTDNPKISCNSDLDVPGESEPFSADSVKGGDSNPTEKIGAIFANACTEIIKGELEKAYGETVYKMITKPPWGLEDCLNYIKRFWVPVFSLIITQKQCLKTVDDLLEYLKTHKGMVEGDSERFVKLALSLCVYFKNCLTPYESLMKTCISEIQKTIE